MFETKVDVGPRIRLAKPVVDALHEHGDKTLWLYTDPTEPCLIVCPESSRKAYVELAVARLPGNMPFDEAYRRFICAGQPVPVRDHGKISIGRRAVPSFAAQPGEMVVILGVGLWYEVWRAEDWHDRGERPAA
jgi:DNA-binding transcriptional regulator/RsmH inhibitor MraZ